SHIIDKRTKQLRLANSFKASLSISTDSEKTSKTITLTANLPLPLAANKQSVTGSCNQEKRS
ncbi:hypothetical protein, partial [Streptococcus cristatus]|uniref:hypothetical protein n=1 Tax=Streptococcus cristatus TaxID=45634 RepID=UPI0022850EBA